jgi:hypothetical protein
MRSELVYAAGIKVVNRFLLATVAMKAIRKLHIGSTRTEDTVNMVLIDLASGRYADESRPAIVPPPAIDSVFVDVFASSAA